MKLSLRRPHDPLVWFFLVACPYVSDLSGSNGLPVIVVYPDYEKKSDIINCSSNTIKQKIKNLWDKLPAFRNLMDDVPTMHIPNKKILIRNALNDSDFMVATKCKPGVYFYKC